MYMRSWNEANFIKYSHLAGARFEDKVLDVVRQYTNAVWRNVRVETLLTQTGNTELDIVIYHGGVVFILELKRVRKIVGSYGDHRWKMFKWHGHVDELDEYTSLNVIGQNNIHARSFMDLYYSEFRCFPVVCPLIIVPNNCEIPEELRGDVFTVNALEDYLQAHRAPGVARVPYRISYLLNNYADMVYRKDFELRGYHEGFPVRGRKVES